MEAAVIVLQYSDVPDQHTGVSPIAHKVQLLSVNTWVAVAGLSFVSLLSAHLASLLGCVWSVVFIFNFKTRQKKSIKPKLLIFSKYINNNNIHWAHYRSQQAQPQKHETTNVTRNKKNKAKNTKTNQNIKLNIPTIKQKPSFSNVILIHLLMSLVHLDA